ncbi:Ltp family lipoprotein [Cellulomonas taurus]|uniref:Ltp family lipoprotein n=1 Tax=Cellulomonas taurus TaxID=2729175 RepID=UPI001FED0F17|nr:Ltp family lipoprotein [Cellulomonas taurus]
MTASVIAFFVVVGVAAGLSGGSDDAASRGDGAPTTAVDRETSDTIEVPDVVGMSLADATAAIEAAGLTVGTIGDAGEVESQAPSGGQSVDPKSQVMLTVVDRAAEEAAAAAAQAEADAAAAAAEAAKGTVSQQNAYQAAQSYLSFTSFSRAGLIDQLTSEYGDGYPPEDAEFAVARLEAEGGVDWNAEAAEAAASYLGFTSFSRQGLLDQLTSEYGDGFTPEQAEYGVSTTGL